MSHSIHIECANFAERKNTFQPVGTEFPVQHHSTGYILLLGRWNKIAQNTAIVSVFKFHLPQWTCTVLLEKRKKLPTLKIFQH